LKYVDGATPRVSVPESSERRFGATPNLVRGEARSLTGKFILKEDGMAKSEQPEIPVVVPGPTKGVVDHNGMSCVDCILDGIFSHSIVMMTTNPTEIDALSLGGQFGTKFFGGIYAIVGTIGADTDTNRSC
jgi:hypothetical protein